jgi:uncharacterized protein (TIGR00369 family)
MVRSGPFWEAAQGRSPLPPAAATLGFELIDADEERGTIEVAFLATDSFVTPVGDVLGGFLAAMLYDTVGPCVIATLPPDQFIETLDLQVRFLAPVFPGRITGRGRILHRHGNIADVEASLHDDRGGELATASATIRIVSFAERVARVSRT